MKETGDSQHIYQKELDKACFQHDMEIMEICIKEKTLIKYYMIKHLLLLKMCNIKNIKEVFLPWWFKVMAFVLKWWC